MHKIEQHTRAFLSTLPVRRYLLACSGGIDSVVLFHLLKKSSYSFEVMHVNYKLRGEASDLDQAFVEEMCSTAGIKCHVQAINMIDYLKANGGNLQQEARKFRYAFFESIRADGDAILLAHHADDQVETFFLNLSREAGFMGLSAMLPMHNNYIRPLLSITKEEILCYAKQENITWREDASNQLLKYNRNKWRHVFLPFLEETIPSIKASILTLIPYFQEGQLELENSVASFVHDIQTEGNLPYATFDSLDEHGLAELCAQLGLSKRNVTSLQKIRRASKGSFLEMKVFDYHFIVHERNALVFCRTLKCDDQFVLHTESVVSLPATFDKHAIYVNPSKIKGRLHVRPWQKGDRMAPVGMKGTKLISDILTDAGVEHSSRSSKLVVCDEEKILWCVGHCIGREALATDDSEKCKIVVLPENAQHNKNSFQG